MALEKIRELTDAEKAKPWSKWYYRPVDDPDPVLLEAVRPDRPMDPSQAIYPEEINRLLDPGYMEVETGWCNLPNGAGYICVNNKMPGVTVDMLDWWFVWHSLADMHYGIWYPPGHYGIAISEKSRKKVLEPAGEREDLRPHRPREGRRGYRPGGHLHLLLPSGGDRLRYGPIQRPQRRRGVWRPWT